MSEFSPHNEKHISLRPYSVARTIKLTPTFMIRFHSKSQSCTHILLLTLDLHMDALSNLAVLVIRLTNVHSRRVHVHGLQNQLGIGRSVLYHVTVVYPSDVWGRVSKGITHERDVFFFVNCHIQGLRGQKWTSVGFIWRNSTWH